jgi:transposase
MVTIGADSHKATHTFVVADGNGRQLAQKTVKATSGGHLEALAWASQWLERYWALEDCRQVSRRLEADLLSAGETVIRVPPKLMAGVRKEARTPGKSDPIDALETRPKDGHFDGICPRRCDRADESGGRRECAAQLLDER